MTRAAAARGTLRVAIVGVPGCPRVALFQRALESAGQPPAGFVSYLELIDGASDPARLLPEGGLVRVESPGRDFEVEKALIALGASVEDGPGSSRIARYEAMRLTFDRGRIWHPRQWYLGFREVLRRIDAGLDRSAHGRLNPAEEVATMFDKRRCHALLTSRGVPCPEAIAPVGSYEELREGMRREGMGRVFVKLAHGSSASGIVALAVGARGVVAMTTVEVERGGGGLRLYNTRAVRRVEDEAEVAAIVDALAREGVHVERWVPKAGVDGRSVDLRVVTIAGKVGHAVLRMAKGPMTNLHLGNERGDVALLRNRMSADAWDAAMSACERAAAAFPGSLHAGVDLLVRPDFRRHAVLEVNAFGDLLHGVSSNGRDAYAAEVEALVRGGAA